MITSAKFVKGIVGEDETLENEYDQVAFIGRSNVGKSSVINSLVGQKDLARTSSFPGRTQEVNLYLISASGGKTFYLADLPGYGYAKGSKDEQERLQQIIYWYLLGSGYEQKKVVLIIDANVGPTDNDLRMLHSLKEAEKQVIIVANKIDKMKKSSLKEELKKIQDELSGYKLVPYSAEKKIGVNELLGEILK